MGIIFALAIEDRMAGWTDGASEVGNITYINTLGLLSLYPLVFVGQATAAELVISDFV